MPLSDSDLHHARETWHELQLPCECEMRGECCDCHSSEIVMLSTGYAEVWRNGDVTQFGCIIADVSELGPQWFTNH